MNKTVILVSALVLLCSVLAAEANGAASPNPAPVPSG